MFLQNVHSSQSVYESAGRRGYKGKEVGVLNGGELKLLNQLKVLTDSKLVSERRNIT